MTPATNANAANRGPALAKWQDKFDLVLSWYRGDTDVVLPADLERQRLAWAHIYGLISAGKYPKDPQLINAILQAYPNISQRTAYTYLRDARRFYTVLSEVDMAFERVMLIMDLKDDMRMAKKKGDLRSLAALRKVFSTIIGADKAAEVVENKTIINILNFNPEQLGGELMDEAKLQRMVKNMLAEDKKKQDKEFDDFDDVSDPA